MISMIEVQINVLQKCVKVRSMTEMLPFKKSAVYSLVVSRFYFFEIKLPHDILK